MRKIVFPLLVAKAAVDREGNPIPAPRVGDILANTLQPTREEGGVTFEIMETWVPLARKLRKAETEIILEDAEYTLLQDRFQITKWLSATEDIVAIGQAIHGAEIVEIEEAVPAPAEEEGKPDSE